MVWFYDRIASRQTRRKKGNTMRGLRIAAAVALAGLPAAAQASETITYTYDARGRLMKVEHSGTVNNNVKAEYTHDKADNRTNVKVSGATS